MLDNLFKERYLNTLQKSQSNSQSLDWRNLFLPDEVVTVSNK